MIIPDLTFVATANDVNYIGTNVVFVDVEEDTLCIDPAKIENSMTSKTKAIIPVHLYGHPANMTEVSRIARKYNLVVVEDTAESHGAEILGRRSVLSGNAGCSFFMEIRSLRQAKEA